MNFRENNKLVYNSIDTIFKNFKNDKKNIIEEVMILNTISGIFQTCNLEMSDEQEKKLKKIYSTLSKKIGRYCPDCRKSNYKSTPKLFTTTRALDRPISISTLAYINYDPTRKEMLLNGCVLVDTVSYVNLTSGKEYKLIGRLYDKTNSVFTDATSTLLFTPTSSSGNVSMEIDIIVSDEYNFFNANQGSSFVMFQYLYDGNTLIASHEDVNDANQTLYAIRDTKIKSTTMNVLGYEDDFLKLTDTIVFENLLPNTEYKIETVFINKKGEIPLLDFPSVTNQFISGDNINETYVLNFSFPLSLMRYYTYSDVVTYEYLYLNDVLIASHEDFYDPLQNFIIPNYV